MRHSTILAVAAAAALLSGPAAAGVIYENPSADFVLGSCAFATACSVPFGFGDHYAAQQFTLAGAAVVKSASFILYDQGVVGTGANWGFYLGDGAGGRPGTLLMAGSSPILQNTVLATGLIEDTNRTQSFFDVPSVALGPGTYYFAIQSITDQRRNFLAHGAAESGAAETSDGGGTWVFGYRDLLSVAVSLYDTSIGGDPDPGDPGSIVPEPGAWALMLVGFGTLGAALRRRRAGLSPAP